MTNKLSERQLARLKELWAEFQKNPKAKGWTFSRDLRTDESLFKRGLVNRRGIPGDIGHPPEYCLTRKGYEAQID